MIRQDRFPRSSFLSIISRPVTSHLSVYNTDGDNKGLIATLRQEFLPFFETSFQHFCLTTWDGPSFCETDGLNL